MKIEIDPATKAVAVDGTVYRNWIDAHRVIAAAKKAAMQETPRMSRYEYKRMAAAHRGHEQ